MSSNIEPKEKYANVLVCGDDPIYLMSMRQALEAEGFSVIDAADGEAALNKCFAYQPDIVLLDVYLPIVDGFDVCQKIKETPLTIDIPVLMVTGDEDFSLIEKAYSAGAADLLPRSMIWPIVTHKLKYLLRTRNAIHDLKLNEDRLRYLAYHEPLTGLHNRQHFNEQLNKFIGLANRGNYYIATVFIDLDRFKRINETLGRKLGDKLLQQVAIRINSNLRNSDLLTHNLNDVSIPEIARLGGDEFTIILSHVSSFKDTDIVVQRLVEAISEPFKLEQYEVVVTPSIGISFYPSDGNTVDDLVENATTAMDYAKDSGGNCFRFYSDVLSAKATESLKLEQGLRAALRNNEFELYYQPQVCVKTNKINCVEALIRWHHPELGLIVPDQFIPIAEESGVIVDVGQWVLETACAQAHEWLKQGLGPVRVAVNISGQQFKSSSFVGSIRSVLAKTKLPAQLLELELTESVVMSDVNENIARLLALKEIGLSLAIDNFGTGYSSLNYLQQFPIDALKIDRSFIIDIADDSTHLATVENIIALASTMDLAVVAEGVETITQLQKLKDINCSIIQGFYFSKALPEQYCTELIMNGLPTRVAGYC